jgi:hypothetical protein
MSLSYAGCLARDATACDMRALSFELRGRGRAHAIRKITSASSEWGWGMGWSGGPSPAPAAHHGPGPRRPSQIQMHISYFRLPYPCLPSLLSISSSLTQCVTPPYSNIPETKPLQIDLATA